MTDVARPGESGTGAAGADHPVSWGSSKPWEFHRTPDDSRRKT